ncbi:MAG: RNA chaperone Hfq [Oscillospiraceae bacterium]|jgi:host factor-I protein
MPKSPNLQDSFLAHIRQNRLPVTIFLVNGYQLRGYVSGFDPFTIVLMSDGKQQLIYKHAISTIVPQHPVAFLEKTVLEEDAP